jgi:hypothetical protein
VDPEFEVAKAEKLQRIHKILWIDRATRLRKNVIKPPQVFSIFVWHQLALHRSGGGRGWGPRTYGWRCSWVPKVRVLSTGIDVILDMATLRRMIIRFFHLLVHLVGDNLTDGFEEGGK